ncbi:glycosyltransferase family 4 protein [Cochleicola gelatinilyticus]|uniref:Glycosyl transferase family 1 n=1 Tax=Cochleicola gelatinilyticus TaxID=1763537 RepID=A0A167K838_9FLAO|nr:glycosyltransferase family 4 protein [Cochleicola gelatinilyticus]OAB81485.1 hypothetical protein ULVI_01305 [Cochleicola gelatinilyticus]
MKVLHISGSGSWGGNEQQMVDLIPELEKIGVQNAIFGVTDGALHTYAATHRIPFIEAQGEKMNTFANYKFLKTILKNTETDILHLHSSNAVTTYVISDLLYGLKKPTVFSKKGMGSSMSFLSRYKYNYKNLHKIICISEAVRTFMKDGVIKPKNHSKLEVVYDGINVERLVPKRTDSVRELFNIPKHLKIIGNIANQFDAKDLSTLFNMMHYLVHELNYKDVHLLQIGKFTNLTDGFKAQIEALEISNYVTLAGYQDHATDLMAQFDVFIMSSQREGGPLTVYESFYKKIPVVSTRVGVVPEVIEDGVNGFSAEVKDYKSLAEKTKTLLEDPMLQKQFKEQSYALFEDKFNADVTAVKTLKIYQALMK